METAPGFGKAAKSAYGMFPIDASSDLVKGYLEEMIAHWAYVYFDLDEEIDEIEKEIDGIKHVVLMLIKTRNWTEAQWDEEFEKTARPFLTVIKGDKDDERP